MDNYTIRCTEEQTKKALELDAPIELLKYNSTIIKTTITFDGFAIIPTAEEMCGWLRTKGIAAYAFVDNNEKEFTGWSYEVVKDFTHGGWKNTIAVPDETFDTYREATLASIDAALKYLSNKK